MKRIRRILAWILVLALTAADGGASALAADTLALPAETTVIEEEAFFGDTSLDEVVLPEGVTAIGPRAFAGSSVSRIYLPASLTEIAEDAFSACDWVVGYGPDGTAASAFFDRHGNLTFEREHDIWEDFSFEAIDETSCRLGRYYGTDTEVRIPSHNADGLAVTEISSSAFSYKNIQSVYVPEGVTVISSSAFMECHDLTEVVLPESLKSIGYNAFAECTSLQSLHIPDSVETLYYAIFSGCDSLTEVNVPLSLTTVLDYGSPFVDCPALRTVTIPEGMTVVPKDLFSNLSSNIETLTLPGTLKRIEARAFYYNTGLKTLVIPETDGLIIEDEVFYGCSGLESVKIGEGLTEIGISAFEGCTSLTDVMLPESLKTVGNCAFQGCSALTALELPRSVTRISLSMFAGCSALSYMPLRDSLAEIDMFAFENCALETVFIPDGIKKLDYGTFSGNANLSAVYIPPSVTSVVNDLTDVFAGCAAPLSIYGWSGSYFQEHFQDHFEDYDGDFVFCDVAETGLPFGADGAALPAEAAARITGVSLDEASIEVGSAMKFRVSTQNATRVQLVVDGEYYDEYTVDGDGTVQAQRVLTMAGDRQVAFRAYGEGGWGPVSPAQTLQVTAEGALAAPEAQWPQTIYREDPLTIRWQPVENARGYVLYLRHPDGQTDKIQPNELDENYSPGSETEPCSYTWPAGTFGAAGNWSILLMAYGRGYSQSSLGCDFTVKGEYKPWTGWVQREKAKAYVGVDDTDANGHFVDYLDPVTVLDETDNGRYKIEMTLTAGGTAIRYVSRDDIGLEPYSPDVTVSASYCYWDDGRLVVTARTNLPAILAGVNNAGGEELSRADAPSRRGTYTQYFDFVLPAVTETTVFTVWAKDADGNRVQKTLTAEPRQETPEPDPAQEEENTPPADTELIPETEPTTPRSCSHIVNGEHEASGAYLKDYRLRADESGNFYISSGVCTECGATVYGRIELPGPAPMRYDNGTYTSSGQTSSLRLNKSVEFACDTVFTDDLDLCGATLTVNGTLTVRSRLSNVGAICCQGLKLEKGGILTLKAGADVRSNGADITVDDGAMLLLDGGRIYTSAKETGAGSGNLSVNGDISAREVYASRISVGSNGYYNIQRSTAYASFEFKSNRAQSSYFLGGSIDCRGNMRVRGKCFQYEGDVSVGGKLNVDNSKGANSANYIRNVTFMTPVLGLTHKYNSKTKETEEVLVEHDISSSTFRATGEVRYIRISQDAVCYLRDTLLASLKNDLMAYIKNASGFVDVILGVKSYLSLFRDVSGEITKDHCRSLLEADAGSGEMPDGLALKTVNLYSPTPTGAQRQVYEQVLSYGLMKEMFTESTYRTIKGKTFTIDFKAMRNQDYAFLFNGVDWILSVSDTSNTMSVNVDGNYCSEISWIRGTLVGMVNGAVVYPETHYEVLPSRENMRQTASAIDAAGRTDAAAILQESALEICGWARTCCQECDTMLADLQNNPQALHNSVFETAVDSLRIYVGGQNILYYDGILKGIMDDCKLEKEIFNNFADMCRLAVSLRKRVINVG